MHPSRQALIRPPSNKSPSYDVPPHLAGRASLNPAQPRDVFFNGASSTNQLPLGKANRWGPTEENQKRQNKHTGGWNDRSRDDIGLEATGKTSASNDGHGHTWGSAQLDRLSYGDTQSNRSSNTDDRNSASPTARENTSPSWGRPIPVYESPNRYFVPPSPAQTLLQARAPSFMPQAYIQGYQNLLSEPSQQLRSESSGWYDYASPPPHPRHMHRQQPFPTSADIHPAPGDTWEMAYSDTAHKEPSGWDNSTSTEISKTSDETKITVKAIGKIREATGWGIGTDEAGGKAVGTWARRINITPVSRDDQSDGGEEASGGYLASKKAGDQGGDTDMEDDSQDEHQSGWNRYEADGQKEEGQSQDLSGWATGTDSSGQPGWEAVPVSSSNTGWGGEAELNKNKPGEKWGRFVPIKTASSFDPSSCRESELETEYPTRSPLSERPPLNQQARNMVSRHLQDKKTLKPSTTVNMDRLGKYRDRAPPKCNPFDIAMGDIWSSLPTIDDEEVIRPPSDSDRDTEKEMERDNRLHSTDKSLDVEMPSISSTNRSVPESRRTSIDSNVAEPAHTPSRYSIDSTADEHGWTAADDLPTGAGWQHQGTHKMDYKADNTLSSRDHAGQIGFESTGRHSQVANSLLIDFDEPASGVFSASYSNRFFVSTPSTMTPSSTLLDLDNDDYLLQTPVSYPDKKLISEEGKPQLSYLKESNVYQTDHDLSEIAKLFESRE